MSGSFQEQQKEQEIDYLFEKLNNIDQSLQGRLTKRELFAAMAMQGVLAGGAGRDQAVNNAHWAIKHADALIAELNEEQKA